ncbi:MAG: dipeptidase PepV [Erysipelothrix sp.]|nr:dipeptidase PepV [Erysipelothrix sp.]
MNYKNEAQLREQDLVSDLKAMVAIKSIYDPSTISENAPYGKNIRTALDRFLAMAERDGFVYKDVDGHAGYIEYGEGEELVGVLGHLDVVPLGEGWSKDPLGGEEEDGYIFGRGTSDDKGPSMAAYYALKILKDNNVKLNRRVRVIVGCDEETGFRGVKYYKEHEEVPNFGFTPDANFPVIYGEKGIIQLHLESNIPTIITQFKAGEVGNVVIGRASASVSEVLDEAGFASYLKLHNLKGDIVDGQYYIEGKSAHAMAPHEGINAGVHLLTFIALAHQDEYARVLSELLHTSNGAGLNIDFTGEYMGPLTLNVGVVDVKSTEQSILIDIRYPDGYSDTDVLDAIKKTVEPLNISMRVVENKGIVFLDPKGKMISILEDVYRQATHDFTSPLVTMGGGTYAKAFDNHVAYGMEFPLMTPPDTVGDVHQADEAVSKEALVLGCAIYAEAIEKLCNM